MLDNGRANVALAKTDDVGDEAAAVLADHLDRPTHRVALEFSQNRSDLRLPQKFGYRTLLQSIPHELIQGFEVDVVGSHLSEWPRLAQFPCQLLVEGLGLVPQVLEPLAQCGVVGVAMHEDIEFSIVGDAGQREVAGTDDGDAIFLAWEFVAKEIIHRAVVEDVGFCMQPALGIHAYIHATFAHQSNQRPHQGFGIVGLVHGRHVVANAGRCLHSAPAHLNAAGIQLRLRALSHLVQPAIALRDLFQRLAAACVADQQTQMSHVGELRRHRFQAAEEEVADGELGRLAARQDALNMIDQPLVAVVYNIVSHWPCPSSWLR